MDNRRIVQEQLCLQWWYDCWHDMPPVSFLLLYILRLVPPGPKTYKHYTFRFLWCWLPITKLATGLNVCLFPLLLFFVVVVVFFSYISIGFDCIENLSHTPIMKHSQGNQWSWENLPDSLTGFIGSHKGNICCWFQAHHMLSCSLSEEGENMWLDECILTIRSALEQSTCCVSVAKVAHMGRPLVTAVILKIFLPPFGYITALSSL